MRKRIGFVAYGVLFLALAFAGAWACWEVYSPRYAWILDDPVRMITDFASQEKLAASFRLRNTTRMPLRILGAETC